jgi:UDP-glucose 4-epimerase
MSVKEIIDVAREVTGHPIPAGTEPRRAGDPPRLIACSDLIKEKLGWQPQFEDAETIIASVWKWIQKNPDGYDC